MATEERDEGEGGPFDQDPFVEQMRPEPSAPPSEVVVLEGLAGRSDREGWARLYFRRALHTMLNFAVKISYLPRTFRRNKHRWWASSVHGWASGKMR